MTYFRCEFLLQKKGPDFVHKISAAFPNVPRPQPGSHDIPPNEEMGASYSGAASVPPPEPQVSSNFIQISYLIYHHIMYIYIYIIIFEIIYSHDIIQETAGQLWKEVEASMQSGIVSSVLNMGFDRELVRRVLRR